MVTATSNSSISGTETVSKHGQSDLLVLKLDANGTILWQKMYGGTGNEDDAVVALAPDGGYFSPPLPTLPTVISPGCCYPPPLLEQVMRGCCAQTAAGNIIWSKVIGGSAEETSTVLYVNSTSIYLGINTLSSDRDFSTNLGLSDIALFKFNLGGSLLWKKQYVSGAARECGGHYRL